MTQWTFEKIAKIIGERGTPHAHMIGLTTTECAPAKARTRIAYNPAFVGDSATGVIHGGLVTTMLDETSGSSVQLALEKPSPIATLDLRIDYMRPAEPGKDLFAFADCYRVTRSIAFTRAIAYQGEESNLIASASAAFMISASRLEGGWDAAKVTNEMMPPLALPPDNPSDILAASPYARLLGINMRQDGTTTMPYHPKLIGNPILPALHGGVIGAFLETTALFGVIREIGPDVAPKPIGLTVDYLRSGKPLDTFARVRIVKQGRRVVAFEAQAWQTSPSLPIASAYGHLMLKKEPGEDA